MSYSRVSKPTPQYTDQKAGTSGLRKPTRTFVDKEKYLDNYVQATLTAVAQESATGSQMPKTLVLGGDGRYFCVEASQIILRIAAGNGIERVVVGQNALLSTPAVSALVRRHATKPDGAFILTASHNPGGIDADFGIKYNGANGGPAQESLTGKIYEITKSIREVNYVELPPTDLAKLGTTTYDIASSSSSSSSASSVALPSKFEVVVVDSVENYAQLMSETFDLATIKKNLFERKGFTFCFDAMNGIAGPYARRIFVDLLGAPAESVRNAYPKPDFGGLHPDPNLTYAEELVKIMGLTRTGQPLDEKQETASAAASTSSSHHDASSSSSHHATAAPSTPLPNYVPEFGAAADGDADRNMVLGRRFFVTPSDSVAIIAANASSIPYFSRQGGLKSVARSMPTSAALDRVAAALSIKLFEVPTGWKFFGNLMDSDVLFGQQKYTPLLCGEESFGTGSDHVREKDGIWAVLAWLSILAARNPAGAEKFVSVQDIVEDHWRKFGRNYYARLDYENVTSEAADKMMAHLRALQASGIASVPSATVDGDVVLPQTDVQTVDDFCYVDPVDKSTSAKQGVRIVFKDGSRYVFRLSGTGSSGATIRLYVESYIDKDTVAKLQGKNKTGAMPPTMTVLERFIKAALATSKLEHFTGRTEPTVIT